jgi:hypothetical protein
MLELLRQQLRMGHPEKSARNDPILPALDSPPDRRNQPCRSLVLLLQNRQYRKIPVQRDGFWGLQPFDFT